MTGKYSLLPAQSHPLTSVQTALQQLSEKHPEFEIQPVNTIRQSDIDKIVKRIESHMIHVLELPIKAQDLVKADQTSTCF